MVDFRRGGKAAEEQAKKQNSFSKTYWLDVSDGEKVILRFLDDSDDWIYTNQHNFVPTKGAPADASEEDKKKFPSNMSAVCRHDEAFKGIYSDCFICDQMVKENGKSYRPSLRLWARAVEREEVRGTQEMADAGKIDSKMIGKRVGFKDKLVEEPVLNDKGEPTGKSELRRKIIVIRMGMKNFFGQLQGYYDVYDTVLDRDYHVTRVGTGMDTDYKIVPLEVIPGHDLRNPETRQKYETYSVEAGVDLGTIIESQADDDFYARFFDTTKVAKPRGKKDEGSEDKPATAPADQQTKPQPAAPSADALAAMRERVRGGNPAPVTTEPEPAASGAINFSE